MISASANRTNAGIAQRRAVPLPQIVLVPPPEPVEPDQRVEALKAECADLKSQLRELQDFMRGAQINGRTVLAEVSQRREMPIEHIIGYGRQRAIVEVRQEAMYEVASRCPWLSLPQLGNLFKRDHTTIINALQAWPRKARLKGIHVPPIYLKRAKVARENPLPARRSGSVVA